MTVDRDDVAAADKLIDGWIRRTPILDVTDRLRFKLEYVQHSGSFKARGAFHRLLRAQRDGALPAAGVIAASGGNAGLGVAYAAGRLGVPAEIFVPVISSPVKVARLRSLGATVHQQGNEFAEALAASRVRAEQTGALFCHAYDQEDVVAGQGTLGLELSDVDTVLVSCGGGGLSAGVAAALEGRARVVAVEPELAPTAYTALAAGEPVDVPVSGVAADSLGARRLGTVPFEVFRRTGVVAALVDDPAIVAARLHLWSEFRIAVEFGAAAAYAALHSGVYVPEPDERVTVVLCGANTDPADLSTVPPAG